MIFFLYGSDNFRSRQKLNEIVDQYKKIHKSGLNFSVIDCKTASFNDFKSELETISMFEEKKLIVLKNIFLNEDFGRSFQGYKEIFSKEFKNIIVIFEDGKVDNKKAFFKFLKENAKAQEFDFLEGKKLQEWVKGEFEKHGLKINPEAMECMMSLEGLSLWQISNEIKKIAAFKLKDKNSQVSARDLEILTKPDNTAEIFKTIDAISSKNKKTALNMVHNHMEKGESPVYLLSMISFQFRNLLIVKNLIEKGIQYQSIASASGLHPFVVMKSYALCQKFSFPELKKIYQKIFQVDCDIKTGKVDDVLALDLLIAGI